MQEMEQLQHSPGWRVLKAGMRESRDEADQLLHHARADDTVAVAMAQAQYAAIDHLMQLPAAMIRLYTEQLQACEKEESDAKESE
jgi:hypothetical protein